MSGINYPQFQDDIAKAFQINTNDSSPEKSIARLSLNLSAAIATQIKLNSSSEYVLPIATSSLLGGVRIGGGISIDNEGVISVALPNNPTYAFSDLTSHPTTFAGYGITDTPWVDSVATALSGKQNKLSGNGYLKVNGTDIVYDNSVYNALTANLPTIDWVAKTFTSYGLTTTRGLAITNGNQTVNLTVDCDGKLLIDKAVYSLDEISAYGAGMPSGGGTGGLISQVFGYDDLAQEFDNSSLDSTFNAYTTSKIANRLSVVEGYADNYALKNHSHAFSDLTSHPTTFAGYGITETPWTSYLLLTGGTLSGALTVNATTTTRGLTITNGINSVNLSVDSDGFLFIDNGVYSNVEISAYGVGSGTGVSGGGLISQVFSYQDLQDASDGTFSDADLTNTFNAFSSQQLKKRISILEANGASTAYVDRRFNDLIGSAPASLDALNELANALGNDPNFAGTVTNLIGTKQPQLNGSGFVKISGTTISYDNSTYLTTSIAAGTYLTKSQASSTYLTITNAATLYLTKALATSTYLPLAGGTITGNLNVNNTTTLNGLTISNGTKSVNLIVDANGFLSIDKGVYSTDFLSAYGVGVGGSGGGLVQTVYALSSLGGSFNNSNLTDTFNAYTINQINSRLVNVESGSATSLSVTGSGNAITSISKTGNLITATLGSTFSLSTHNHSLNNLSEKSYNSLTDKPVNLSQFNNNLGNYLGAVLTSQSTPQTIGSSARRLGKLWGDEIEVSNTFRSTVFGAVMQVYNGSSVGTKLRWEFESQAPETGGNVGSDLRLYRFDDSGGYLGGVYTIHRNGLFDFDFAPTIAGVSLDSKYIQNNPTSAQSGSVWVDGIGIFGGNSSIGGTPASDGRLTLWGDGNSGHYLIEAKNNGGSNMFLLKNDGTATFTSTVYATYFADNIFTSSADRLTPNADNAYYLGDSGKRWKGIYGNYGNFSGDISASQFIGNGAGLTGTASSLTAGYSINSDKLDGLNAGDFAGYAYFSSDVLTPNIPNDYGFFNCAADAINKPSGGTWIQGIQMPFADNLDYRQILVCDGSDLYYRSQSGGDWGNYKKFWHNENSNLSTVDWNARTLYINQIKPTSNIRSDGGYGGIDLYDNGYGYTYAAKLFTFKSDSSGEYYGLTQDYSGSGAQLSIIAKQSSGNIKFYVGDSGDKESDRVLSLNSDKTATFASNVSANGNLTANNIIVGNSTYSMTIGRNNTNGNFEYIPTQTGYGHKFIGSGEFTAKVTTNTYFKTTSPVAMCGDYDENGTTDKVIWTIGNSWASVANAYGLGYTYNNIPGYGHSLYMGYNGSKQIQFSLESGSAKFNGSIQATQFTVANSTGVYVGTGDDASYDNCNIDIKSWQGIGFIGSAGNIYGDGTRTVYINARNGSIGAKGDIISNGRFIGAGAIISGNIQATGEITAYSASDKRLKSNIKSIGNSLDIINQLNPVSYNWNEKAKELNSNKTDKKDVGLIAQELKEVLPELVHTVYNDEYLSVDYVKLIPYLIGAIQGLTAKINTLEGN